jgi:VanZ family protein
MWAAVLFLLSATPLDLDRDWWLGANDKLVHLGLYAVLGAALAFARARGTKTVSHLAMIAIGAAYGVSDEWHQSFVPGRVPSVGDWLADAAGVALGYGLVLLVVYRRRGEERGE